MLPRTMFGRRTIGTRGVPRRPQPMRRRAPRSIMTPLRNRAHRTIANRRLTQRLVRRIRSPTRQTVRPRGRPIRRKTNKRPSRTRSKTPRKTARVNRPTRTPLRTRRNPRQRRTIRRGLPAPRPRIKKTRRNWRRRWPHRRLPVRRKSKPAPAKDAIESGATAKAAEASSLSSDPTAKQGQNPGTEAEAGAAAPAKNIPVLPQPAKIAANQTVTGNPADATGDAAGDGDPKPKKTPESVSEATGGRESTNLRRRVLRTRPRQKPPTRRPLRPQTAPPARRPRLPSCRKPRPASCRRCSKC